MYLLTNGRVITRDEGGKGYYEKGAVVYEGSKIVEVGEEAALTAKYPQAERIDAKGGVNLFRGRLRLFDSHLADLGFA